MWLNLATWVGSNWSASVDQSPKHLSVQVIPNMVAEMWRRPILLEDSVRW
jgi:hypothetical protein